jgi:signal peptidase
MSGALRWVRLVLAWVVILGIGAALLAAVVIPRLTGATPYVIETGSMRPGMPPGTLVVDRPVAADDIAVGDVITYQLNSGDPTVVTHRVVAQGITLTGQPRFRTQGDANDVADEKWVLPVQVKGERWYAIPYLGYVTSFVTEQQRGVFTGLVVVGLLGHGAVMVAGAARDRRRRVVVEEIERELEVADS